MKTGLKALLIDLQWIRQKTQLYQIERLHSKIACQTQDEIPTRGKIDQFFNRFSIAALMQRCGVRQRHGHSVRSLLQRIFALPFTGGILMRSGFFGEGGK